MSTSKLSKSVATKDKSNLNRELICKTLHSELINFAKNYNDIEKKNKLPSDVDLLVQAHFSEVSSIIIQFMCNSFNKKVVALKIRSLVSISEPKFMLFRLKIKA